MDNIDRDLFGRAVKGAMYQPSDETSHDMRMAAHNLMLSAYEDNLVSSCPGRTRALPLCGNFRTGTSGVSFAQTRHPACTGHLMHQGVMRVRERLHRSSSQLTAIEVSHNLPKPVLPTQGR